MTRLRNLYGGGRVLCSRAIRTSASKGSACSSAVSTGSVRFGDGGRLVRRRPVHAFDACVLLVGAILGTVICLRIEN